MCCFDRIFSRTLINAAALLFCLIGLGLGSTSFAQSFDRIDDQVLRDLGKPGPEDYVSYLRESSLYKASKTPIKPVKDPLKYIKATENRLEAGKLPQTKEAQLLLQLAELYRAAADLEVEKSVKEYEKNYQSWLKSGEEGKAPEFSSDKVNEYLLSQVKVYRTLLQKFPKFEKQPEIIFNLALCLVRVKSPNASIYLGKLEKDFPKSKWPLVAKITTAEMLFAEGKYPEALVFYTSVLKSKNKIVARFANYKAGWIEAYTSTKNPTLRESGYEKLRKTAGLSGSKSDTKKFLSDEATKDLIWMWSETFDEAKAAQFFVKSREESLFQTMERMAWKYETAKQPQKALAIYSKIAAKGPTRLRAPYSDSKILQINLAQNNFSTLAQTIERMSEQYGGKGGWFKANGKNKDAVAGAQTLLKSQSFDLANKMHDKIKSGAKNVLDPALRLSAVYLSNFPNGVEAYLLQYRYASALETAGRPEDAARQYLAVAKSNELKARYRQSASQKMIAVQMAFVGSQKLPAAPAPGTLSKELKIPGSQQLLLEIIDTFAGFYPTDKNIPSYLFAAGKIASDNGHYAEAIKRFDKLIVTYPSSKESGNAIKYVTSVYLQRKEWVNLIAVSRSYLGRKPLVAAASNLQFLRGTLRTGMWEKAVEEYKKNDMLASAVSYQEFQKEFPTDKDADKALAFSTTIYLEKGKGPEAASAGMLLVKTYQKSPYRPDIMIKVADVLEQMLDFPDAAGTFDAFAAAYPTDKRTAASLGKAAMLYLECDKPAAATAVLANLVKRFPNSPDARTAQLRYAEFREGNDEFYTASTAWDKYAQLVRTVSEEEYWYAQAKAASLLFQIQEGRNTGNARMVQMMNQFTKMPTGKAQRGRTIVAKHFMRAFDEKMMEFSGLDINYENKLEFTRTSTAIKLSLAEFEKQQKTLVAVGSIELIPAAFYKLAMCYEMAISAFQGSPIAADHSVAEVHAIDSLKEQSIFSYKDMMQKNYEASYKTASAGGQYNEWRVLAHRKMSKINPKQYPETPEMALRPQYTEIHLSKPKAGH